MNVAPPTPQRIQSTVLLVDSHRSALSRASQELGTHKEVLRVMTVTTGAAALRCLRSQPVNILITQLSLADMSGWQLLDQARTVSPELLLVAIAEPKLDKRPALNESLDKVHVLSKPLYNGELGDFIFSELLNQAHGYLAGIGLPSVLQLLQSERKTCVLKVVAFPQNRGYLFVRRGCLLNARTKNLEAVPAIYEMLSWERPRIELQRCGPLNSKGEIEWSSRSIKIEQSLMQILLDFARLRDEIATEDKAQHKKNNNSNSTRTAKRRPQSGPSQRARRSTSLVGFNMPTGADQWLFKNVHTDAEEPRISEDTESRNPPISSPPSKAQEGETARKMILQLTVTSGQRVGYLYLLQGKLIDAKTEDLAGEQAARTILAWKDVVIKLSHHMRKISRTLPSDLNKLIDSERLLACLSRASR